MLFICGKRNNHQQCASGHACGGRVVGNCGEPLTGRLTGTTCNKPLCSDHLVAGPDQIGRCGAHARIKAKLAARSAAGGAA